MKVTLYMAISIDGFIAKRNGDSDWVSPVDSANFEQKIKEKGCLIVGRRTFNQYQGELYPVKDVTNIVLTHEPLLETGNINVIYVNSTQDAIKLAEARGHQEALLIGGGTTNGIFLKDNLIDELFLSIHPLILGNGIKLFGDSDIEIKLQYLDKKELEQGLIQLHYRVIR